MKKLIPIFITLLVGVAIGWLVSGFDGGSGHNHGNMESAAKDEIWTCSMHPTVKNPGPGKCPICAMDLIPLSKMGGSAGARTVSLSDDAKKLARISTTAVVRKRPEVTVQLFGTLEHDQTRMRTLPARFPGRIERLFVDYNGARVQKGDHLAEIYSPDLLSAQSELLTALRFGNTDGIEAARDKLKLWGFSKKKIEEIEQSKKTSDQLEIGSPISGIVTEKNVNEGDYVKTGDPMFVVADLSEVWAVFHAYESDLPWLRFGQLATFTTEAMGEREFSGRISFIAPEVNPKTRTAEVRINLKNPDGILKPGMFISGKVNAEVIGDGKVIDPAFAGKWISPMHPEIVKDEPGKCDICGMALVKAEDLGYAVVGAGDQESPLVIPASAILHTGKRSVVYVELPDQETPHYRGRDVLVGPRAGDEYIILAGLNEGERVVTNGAFKLDSALQIQADISMMNPDENPKPLFEKWDKPELRPAAEELFSHYLDIQKALVKSDFEVARMAARSLEAILKNQPTEDKEWAILHGELLETATEASGVDDLKKFRAAFVPLTKHIDRLVRRFELPAYVMHCPMAFNDKGGTWLQQSEKLLNPYFGEKMLQCGTVEEELNVSALPEVNPDSTSETSGGNETVSTGESETKYEIWDLPEVKSGAESAFAKYVAIQKALVKSDFLTAKKETAELRTALKKLPTDDKNFAALHKKLSDSSTAAEGTKSLEDFRTAFVPLTRDIDELVRRFELPAFVMHCHMAFNDTGAHWLQNDEELLNPYFGDAMLRCGMVQEKLNQDSKNSDGQ